MGSEIENMFSGGGANGFGDLQQYLQQAQNMAQGNQSQGQAQYGPYQQAGTSSIPQMQQLLQQMQGQNNGNWMNSYQESPYAKYMTGKSLNAMNNAAAGAGVAGTGANQQAAGTMANNIASGDAQNYFHNMMDQNQAELGGYQNMANMGENATNQNANLGLSYSDLISKLLGSEGQAKGNQDIFQQQGKNSIIGKLFGNGILGNNNLPSGGGTGQTNAGANS